MPEDEEDAVDELLEDIMGSAPADKEDQDPEDILADLDYEPEYDEDWPNRNG